MTDQAHSVSRPWRRFLRFSVRGLIVIVLVVGGCLGWIVRSARIQREAVAAIENVGGLVRYDGEGTIGNDIPERELWAPRWLGDLIGVDYFGHVISVVPDSSSTANDSTLAAVGYLTRLRELSVSRTLVSDAGVAHLIGLSELSSLSLPDTQVTDAGLAHLRVLTKLKALGLSKTQVTDAGLTHLEGLTELGILWLDHARVSDNGLSHLTGLNKLWVISLDGTQVTDAGVKDIQRALPKVKIVR